MIGQKQTAVSQRVTSIIASGAIASSLLVTPLTALAADVEPSAGAQTGTGTTEVTVQIMSDNEHGGTDEPKVVPAPEGTDPKDLVDEDGNPDPEGEYIKNPEYNPDDDGDGYGDNIAFTVPSSINFVANAQGKLTGPSAEKTYIENRSVFAIHASSFDVDEQDGWSIIGNGEKASAANSADFQFGPEADTLDAKSYLQKSNVTSPSAWSMAAYDGDASTADRVAMKTSGDIFKVNKDISSKTKIAIIKTYVTAGAGA